MGNAYVCRCRLSITRADPKGAKEAMGGPNRSETVIWLSAHHAHRVNQWRSQDFLKEGS